MQRLFSAIIDKTIKLRNRYIFHCKILGYIFPLYLILLKFKITAVLLLFFCNCILFLRSGSELCWHYQTKLSFFVGQFAVNLFSLSAFKKFSKVEHSIVTWPTNVEYFFRHFLASTQIYKHVYNCLWKNLFHATSKSLQATFVTFSLTLFIQIANLAFICFWVVFNRILQYSNYDHSK